MSEREDQTGFSLPMRVGYEDTDLTNAVYSDTACCCRGQMRIVCVDAQTLRPRRLPKQLLAAISDVH